jgi:hypothetical protein
LNFPMQHPFKTPILSIQALHFPTLNKKYYLKILLRLLNFFMNLRSKNCHLIKKSFMNTEDFL